MALRTGGLAKSGKTSSGSTEPQRIQSLRQEVKEKAIKVNGLRDRVRDIRESALSQSSVANAFQAFQTGPKAFEKETPKEWATSISSSAGKVDGAKTSLYEEETTATKSITVTSEDRGNVGGLMAKFSDMAVQNSDNKPVKAEERRLEEGRKAMKDMDEAREREEIFKKMEAKRKAKYKDEELAYELNEPKQSTFAEKWPNGEPHKQEQLEQYLRELSADLDKQRDDLENELKKMGAF